MAFENKLGITDSAELARTEKRMSKVKALELFEKGPLTGSRWIRRTICWQWSAALSKIWRL